MTILCGARCKLRTGWDIWNMEKQQLIKSQTNCRILNIKVTSTWFCLTHHLFSPLWRRSVGLTTDGHVYTWGHGYNYRLGHGTEANVTYPKRISTIKRKVIDIGVGSKHAVAVCDNGQVGRVMVIPPAGSKPTKSSSGFLCQVWQNVYYQDNHGWAE